MKKMNIIVLLLCATLSACTTTSQSKNNTSTSQAVEEEVTQASFNQNAAMDNGTLQAAKMISPLTK